MNNQVAMVPPTLEPNMNMENMEKITKWLESGAPEHGIVRGFDMYDFFGDINYACLGRALGTGGEEAGMEYLKTCGTRCCIAGAAVAFCSTAPARAIKHEEPSDEAAKLLGLGMSAASELFFTTTAHRDAAWAARCMRKLMLEGIVDWAGTEASP